MRMKNIFIPKFINKNNFRLQKFRYLNIPLKLAAKEKQRKKKNSKFRIYYNVLLIFTISIFCTVRVNVCVVYVFIYCARLNINSYTNLSLYFSSTQKLLLLFHTVLNFLFFFICFNPFRSVVQWCVLTTTFLTFIA